MESQSQINDSGTGYDGVTLYRKDALREEGLADADDDHAYCVHDDHEVLDSATTDHAADDGMI